MFLVCLLEEMVRGGTDTQNLISGFNRDREQIPGVCLDLCDNLGGVFSDEKC